MQSSYSVGRQAVGNVLAGDKGKASSSCPRPTRLTLLAGNTGGFHLQPHRTAQDPGSGGWAIADMSTNTIQHPSIGDVVGRDGDGVVQFLGIQYATLRDRFAESQVRSQYHSPVDATSHGWV